MFHGLSAFPITPADSRGVVDAGAVASLCARLVEARVDSIGLLGSTGTYAYLSREERRRTVRAAISAVAGRLPVIVGIGALRTDAVVDLARDAAEEGADGLLLAPVSYTPLTEDEAFTHYETVAGATGLPLCIYNNPGTTHFSFSQGLLARLADVPGVAAVKMPLPGAKGFAAELAELRAGPAGKLAIGYSGDWGAAEALLAGASAWYSVIAGTLPVMAREMASAAKDGDRATVERIDQQLQPLWALFKAHGSLRVVYAICAELGLAQAELPRPLMPISDRQRAQVREVIAGLS
jgi:4-hydroxy-tetrahydrodipicolinate synthase